MSARADSVPCVPRRSSSNAAASCPGVEAYTLGAFGVGVPPGYTATPPVSAGATARTRASTAAAPEAGEGPPPGPAAARGETAGGGGGGGGGAGPGGGGG